MLRGARGGPESSAPDSYLWDRAPWTSSPPLSPVLGQGLHRTPSPSPTSPPAESCSARDGSLLGLFSFLPSSVLHPFYPVISLQEKQPPPDQFGASVLNSIHYATLLLQSSLQITLHSKVIFLKPSLDPVTLLHKTLNGSLSPSGQNKSDSPD